MNANAENTTNAKTLTTEQWDLIFSQLAGKLRRRVSDMQHSHAQWLIGNPNERIVEPVAAVLMGSLAGEEQKAKKVEEETEISCNTAIKNSDLQFVNEFPIEIPSDFTLKNCLRDLIRYESSLTGVNFPKSGLQKGKKYIAEIYYLKRHMGLADIVRVALKNKRLMGGALAGAILAAYYGSNLPVNNEIVCADIPDNLWRLGGLGVPSIRSIHYSDGSCRVWQWKLYLSGINGGWDKDAYVVFFRELEANPSA